MQDRYFQSKVIIHALQNATSNATTSLQKSKSQLKKAKASKMAASERELMFHLQYYPYDLPAATIQRIVEDCLFNPKYGSPLNQLTNIESGKISIDGILITYSRAPSIGM